MERCQTEFCARRQESKAQERTRDEQHAQRRVCLTTFLVELSEPLAAIETSQGLAEFTRDHGNRLSLTDFHRFVELMQTRHGAALLRQAGFQTAIPRLRVA